jgi:hypothetical protein
MIGEAPARTPLTAREGLFAGVGEANHRTGALKKWISRYGDWAMIYSRLVINFGDLFGGTRLKARKGLTRNI